MFVGGNAWVWRLYLCGLAGSQVEIEESVAIVNNAPIPLFPLAFHHHTTRKRHLFSCHPYLPHTSTQASCCRRAPPLLPQVARRTAPTHPYASCASSSIIIIAKEQGAGEATVLAAMRRALLSRLLPLPVASLLLFLALPPMIHGMIQNFHYEDETSPIFQLETFGFRPGGGEFGVVVVSGDG